MEKAKHYLPSITRDVKYNPFIFRQMFVPHCKMYTLCNNNKKSRCIVCFLTGKLLFDVHVLEMEDDYTEISLIIKKLK